MSSSTVTYTSISSDSDFPSWGFHLISDVEPQSPEVAPQSLDQAPPSPDYVPSPEYPEYLALSDDEIPIEDQPLLADASPTALSPGYVADFDPLEEDLEEDPANEGEEEEEEDSFKDDNEEEEDEASKDDEEEEHLALVYSTLPAIDFVSSAKETKPFETDESAATPPPPRSPQTNVPLSMTRLCRERMTVRPQTPLSAFTKALIVEYAYAPTPPLPPPSLLTPLLSPLPHIPSPPLPLPSPPLPLPSPPLLLPSTAYRTDILEAEMPPRKRVCFTAPTRRFKVGESLIAVAARKTRHTLARRIDYGFIDTLDASIRASEGRVITAVEEVNERVTNLATTQRQDAHELYAWSYSEGRSMPLEALIRAQEARDMVARAFGRIHALEARDPACLDDLEDNGSTPKKTTTPMTDADIKQLIAQEVADALAEYEATRNSRNGDDSHDSRSGGRILKES
ncbi:hypothetical protein Tco_0397602 [Tanacetum coccineum]